MLQAGRPSLFTAELLAKLHLYLSVARYRGPRAVIARVARGLGLAVIWITCLPVTVVLHFAGFRRVTVVTGIIGHLASEVDCFLKARALGELPERRWFILAPANRVANRHLLDYWRRMVPVVSQPVLCALLNGMTCFLLMRYDVSHYLRRERGTQDVYRLNAKWQGRPPVLQLTPDDNAECSRALRALGIPEDAWFVCVHIREPGPSSPHDKVAHSYRDADPRSFIPAMQEIVRRGGWCIRMGNPTMSRLPELRGVIDYAHHPIRSARLDVILCARARFFLGTTSGLFYVSTVFGVPCALANMVPTSVMAPLASDISIPKLLYDERKSRLLRFDEILGSPVGNFLYTKLYTDAGIRIIENTPEDIRELASEMLDRLEGKHVETPEDEELQERFRRLLKPGTYSYGAASRVGTAFLRKYRHLLPA